MATDRRTGRPPLGRNVALLRFRLADAELDRFRSWQEQLGGLTDAETTRSLLRLIRDDDVARLAQELTEGREST